jgi:two-component system sensor histidine kinase UhpB
MANATRILLIENQPQDIEIFEQEIQKSGINYTLDKAETFDRLNEIQPQNKPDLIVCNYRVSPLHPTEAINELKKRVQNTPFIIFSDVLDDELVVQCIKAGASDYVFKQHAARVGTVIQTLIETMRVREELKESKERFNTLAKVSTVGIFLASEEGFFLYVNERWSAITGLQPEQSLGDGFLEAVHSHDRKRVKTEWHRSVRERKPFHSEYRITRQSDNSELWVLGQAFPEIMPDGSVAGFVGTITDITYRMQAEVEIDASRKQLRTLTARLQSVREEERTYISREIHDDLGQSLTGLRMDIVWLTSKLENAEERIRQRLKSMLELTDATIHKVRKIATELRPGILDDIGLAAAIEWHAKDVGSRTGIHCSFDLDDEIQLDEQRSTAFFRIFQESLTNVLRHAQAEHVHTQLKVEGNCIVLLVEDDGKGIAPNELSHPHSVGILGMKERAASFGGEVNVVGIPNKGTSVRVSIPISTS